MRDKISCETVRDLMAMEKEGLLSEESIELVQEHLSQCIHCRRARRDIDSNLKQKFSGSDAPSFPPLQFRKKSSRFLRRCWWVGAVLLLALVLGLYGHNYTQPLVVEQRQDTDPWRRVYTIEGEWEDIKEQTFALPEYDYASPPLYQLVQDTEFKLWLGDEYLSHEESIQVLEGESIVLEIMLTDYRDAALARTGWLVWERATVSYVELSVMTHSTKSINWGRSTLPVGIYTNWDDNYAIPRLMKMGRDRHGGMVPVGISRPGRGGWRP